MTAEEIITHLETHHQGEFEFTDNKIRHKTQKTCEGDFACPAAIVANDLGCKRITNLPVLLAILLSASSTDIGRIICSADNLGLCKGYDPAIRVRLLNLAK